MALKAADRSRIKYHLGYLAVSPASSLQFGIPRPIETLFLVETAMSNVIDDGWNIQNLLRILGILDGLECKMVEAQDYAPALKLGNLERNRDVMKELLDHYYDWSGRLADILGVPRYPYSQRNIDAVMGGGRVQNIPVRH